jgi:hypothetical protein
MLFTLIIYLFTLTFVQNDIEKCEIWMNNHLINSSEIHGHDLKLLIVKIDELSDLTLDVKCDKFDLKTGILKVYATKKILLDNGFDFGNLINLFSYVSDKPQLVQFQNLKGFNQNLLKLKVNKFDRNAIPHELININFDFYQNETLVTQDTCVQRNFDTKMKSFFGSITIMELSNVNYNTKVCPFVFMNTNLKSLDFSQITNSLIFMNRLEFLNINLNQSKDYDIQTKSLTNLKLSVSYESITLSNLNRYAFKNVKYLFLHGYVESIEKDLFYYFKQIRLIYICIENFSQFFHQGIQWMSDLNADLNDVDLYKPIDIQTNSHRIITVQFVEESQSLQRSYLYPNEDICLFKNFPHKKMVVPVIELAETVKECSCTLLWLLQYSSRFKNVNEVYYMDNLDAEYGTRNLIAKNFCLERKNFSASFAACNFTRKFENCLSTNETSTQKTNYFFRLHGNLNLFYFFKWLQYIIEIYFQPLFCSIALFTNFLSIKVIGNKRHARNFQNPMYKHILFNAWFNIFLCLINILSLMNICIFPKSSFCSSVYKEEASQFFKIYVVFFAGNTLRLCCNFSYIFFSLSRGILSTSSRESSLRKLFEKLKTRYFYALIFLFSTVFSIFKVFEYKITEIYNSYETNFPYNAYDIKFCEQIDLNENMDYSPSMCRLMWALNLINNILNNVLFLFLSLIIDVAMIKFTNNLIRQKQALNSPQLSEAIKFKEKLNKMILVNGSLYFFSHVPEFLVTLLLIVYKKKFAKFCYIAFSCSDLIDMAQKFHLIPIALQFFIFYHFDHNFIQSFVDLKRIFFKAILKNYYSGAKSRINQK